MRLFVALEIPDAWRELARNISMLVTQSTLVPMRPVDPALMHITLRFLGEVESSRVDELRESLAAHVAPIEVALRLGSPSTFGPPPRTSVVSLRVEGDLDALLALVHRVELAVRLVGLPPREGRFSPHLTLGRLGREVSAEERRTVAETVRALPPPPPLAYVAREVILVRSILGGRQPMYEVIDRFTSA